MSARRGHSAAIPLVFPEISPQVKACGFFNHKIGFFLFSKYFLKKNAHHKSTTCLRVKLDHESLNILAQGSQKPKCSRPRHHKSTSCFLTRLLIRKQCRSATPHLGKWRRRPPPSFESLTREQPQNKTTPYRVVLCGCCGSGNLDAYCVSTRFLFSQHKNVSKIWENGFESLPEAMQMASSPRK